MTDNLMNGANGALPAHLQGTADEDFGGGMDGGGYPRLAFKGSRFRLRQGDEETVLEQTSIEVIILKDYPHISRIFFESGYDAEGGTRPSCASADGEHPVSTIAYPQHTACATCPQNEKGSAITDDGKKSRACSFFKRLVVIIKGFEDVGPVVADMKSMSLFGDSKSGENLWTLKAYFARLKANGVMPFHLWTKMVFDTDMSVPKVLFHPLGYVNEADFAGHVDPMISTPDGKQLMLEMTDTSGVRVLGDEDGDDKMQLPAGEKPAHLGGPAEPEQKQIAAPADPKPSVLEMQLAEAVQAGDFVKAGQIQQAIAQHQTPAKPEPEKKAEQAGPTRDDFDKHEAHVASMKDDIKKAAEAGNYVKAGDLQGLLQKVIDAYVAKWGGANQAPASEPTAPKAAQPAMANDVNVHGVLWNPEFHATVTGGGGKLNADGHWAARRGISAELKAKVKVPASVEQPNEPAQPLVGEAGQAEDATGSAGFNSELESTLKDFGF